MSRQHLDFLFLKYSKNGVWRGRGRECSSFQNYLQLYSSHLATGSVQRPYSQTKAFAWRANFTNIHSSNRICRRPYSQTSFLATGSVLRQYSQTSIKQRHLPGDRILKHLSRKRIFLQSVFSNIHQAKASSRRSYSQTYVKQKHLHGERIFNRPQAKASARGAYSQSSPSKRNVLQQRLYSETSFLRKAYLPGERILTRPLQQKERPVECFPEKAKRNLLVLSLVNSINFFLGVITP